MLLSVAGRDVLSDKFPALTEKVEKTNASKSRPASGIRGLCGISMRYTFLARDIRPRGNGKRQSRRRRAGGKELRRDCENRVERITVIRSPVTVAKIR